VNTYAYVGNNPLSSIDPLGLAVVFHERSIQATTFGGHTFLELTPDNPEEVIELLEMLIGPGVPAFRGGQSLLLSGINFTDPVTDATVLVGVSARPERARFISGDDPNSARFSRILEAPNYSEVTGSCSIYSDDTLFITNLILANRLYSQLNPNGLPYDGLAGAQADNSFIRGPGKPFPILDEGVEYYNSNSYTAGILVSAGFDLSNVPDPFYVQPGLDKPVPISSVVEQTPNNGFTLE